MNSAIINNAETMVDISANRTLIAAKFTIDDPLKPQAIQGLHTLEQVFTQYAPTVDIRLEDADGFSKSEQLKFKSLNDFSIDGIKNQSTFLKALEVKRNNYLKIAQKIKSLKHLAAMLQDDKKRKLLDTLTQHMINELAKNKK